MTEPKRTKAGVKKASAAKATKAAGAKGSDESRVVFPDPGLHIAVLGALLDEGLVDEEKIEDRLAARGVDVQL